MKTKKERIVRYTVEQLKAQEATGKMGSDWKRAAKMPFA